MNTQASQSTTKKAPPLFAHRAFTLFWASHILTTLAVQAESVTIGWQVYTIARHSRTLEQSALSAWWGLCSSFHSACSL
jgi:hypothetical protein